jgi:hypothetical protein
MSNYKTINHFCTPVSAIPIDITWEKNTYPIDNPNVWGSAQWLCFHLFSTKYPEKPSPIVIEHMKNYILAIPYTLPCEKCSNHARSFIESNYSNLDIICSSKNNLFKFFVDFHNYVNIRYNKPIMSVQDAWKLYTGKATINKMKYE